MFGKHKIVLLLKTPRVRNKKDYSAMDYLKNTYQVTQIITRHMITLKEKCSI